MSNLSTYYAALDRGERHRQPGQLNVVVLDVDSPATGFGRHNRLVGPFGGTGDDAGTITLREDLCSGLPLSTEDDRRKVLRGPDRICGSESRALRLVSSVQYPGIHGADSIEHTYRRATA